MSESSGKDLLTRQEIDDLIVEHGISPRTRRIIVWGLVWLATLCILTELSSVVFGHPTSDALMTLAATAVGGLAGLAIPDRN